MTIASEIQLPEWLTEVEQIILDSLPKECKTPWHIIFTRAACSGSNFDKVKIQFQIFMLESALINLKQFEYIPEKNPGAKTILNQASDVLLQYIEAYRSNTDAHRVWSAARRVCRIAVWTIRDVDKETRDALWYAASVCSAASATNIGWSMTGLSHGSYEKFADKLLELLKEKS